ncbi:hypothetical protein, partial [Ralstonia sp.]|uniref:hypothetical protein n=1 Tax=Ralstonia sp. TaxID=54061 RepID=UPI00257BF934
ALGARSAPGPGEIECLFVCLWEHIFLRWKRFFSDTFPAGGGKSHEEVRFFRLRSAMCRHFLSTCGLVV